MTEKEFVGFLEARVPLQGIKLFHVSPELARRVRDGSPVETEHFRLVETEGGWFEWKEKEGADFAEREDVQEVQGR